MNVLLAGATRLSVYVEITADCSGRMQLGVNRFASAARFGYEQDCIA
jgi:hypothetical protein